MWWTRNPSTFWGGVLVALGVLFLLANTGVLDNVNWDVVWPVILIAIGAWLIVVRVGPSGTHADVDGSEALDGMSKAKLEVAVGAGRLNIRSAALGDRLYQLHIDHAGSAPEVKVDRGRARFESASHWVGSAG